MNQRKFPRASYKCRIRVLRATKEEEVLTYTENIGAGGVCVELEKPLQLFEEVSLDIFLSDEKPPISCKGKIVWVVKNRPMGKQGKTLKYDTGVEFIDMPEKERKLIAQIVKDILSSNA
ncbi:MAG: PilZ domain-containing protein [Candidatus Omnitrophica bacterium]|nr:PilZ domain-containing protein [Candidatus Omnitrophota bacterium]